jgi:hypothetical protein
LLRLKIISDSLVVSPHPLTRLQDLSAFLGGPKIGLPIKDDWDDVEPEFARVMREVLPELADCFPSYKIVQQSAKGKNISPKALQEAYKRAVRKKGQNTTKMAVRRDRHVKEILESAYVIELATGGADKLKKLLDDPQFASDLRAFLKRVPKEQLDKLEHELTLLKKALDARRKVHANLLLKEIEEALVGPAIVGGALKLKKALGGKPKPEKPYYPNPGQGRVVTHPKHGRGFVQEHRAGGKSAVSFDKDVKGAALRSHRVVDTKDLTYKSLAASKVSDKEVISKKAALEYTKSILAKVDFKYSKVQYDRAMDAISWKMNEPSFEHHVDTYFPAGFKEGRIRSDYAAAAYTPKPITIDGKQAYAVMMFGWEDETDDYQDVTDEDEVPVKIIYGGICFVKTLDQANLFKSRNMYDIASFEETAAKKKGAMIRTKVKDDSGANDDHESVGKQIKAAGWRVLKEYKPTKDAGGSYVVQHPHAKHPNEAVHLHTGMPYGVGVVAKKDYKVKRKAKGRFIPSHRVSALLNSWGKVYDKNGTIMESADDEETATSINRGSAAQGVKHKHVTHEKNGVKHWAVVDKESGTVRWSKNAKKATMLPPGAAREVTRVHRGSRVEKATAAVKKGVKKKAAKGPSPGKTAFDKKLAQTKRYLSSYHR